MRVVVAVALLWPVYAPRRPERQTNRVTAAKLLALSLIIYAADNNNFLPQDVPKSWVEQHKNPSLSSVTYNRKLAGTVLPQSADKAEELILVYDRQEVSQDRFAIVDGAGRSRLVSGEVWRTQILPTL